MLFSSVGAVCLAGTLPPPPHSPASYDGIDAPGFVRVQSTAHGGTGGFIDVPGYQACRFVTIDDPTIGGEAILVNSAANWLSWRKYRPAAWQTVCCRPQSSYGRNGLPVALCVGSASGTVSPQLRGSDPTGYARYGESDTVTATCTDASGRTYTDQQTFTCGSTDMVTPNSVTADGQWAITPSCTPNATTSACNATCPGGAGTQTTYDSCGNVQSISACSIGCCTPMWQTSCGGCAGTTSKTCTRYDANNCPGSGSSSYQESCSLVETGSGYCIPHCCPAPPVDTGYCGCGACNDPAYGTDTWVYNGPWAGDVCNGQLCTGPGVCGGYISYQCYTYE